MTQTFATNDFNDIYIGVDGNLAINNGVLAIRDACANAAKTQLGEMVLNIDYGIPNFQALWQGSPNIQQFEAALRLTLLSVDGAVDIISLNTNKMGDILQYNVVILTDTSQTITFSGAFNVSI